MLTVAYANGHCEVLARWLYLVEVCSLMILDGTMISVPIIE